MDDDQALSLRARKQRRTRETILETAMALFAERGFHGVTVDEIAARAEVGRTTFFRYFTDKPELLFADDELRHALTEALEEAARRRAPIGDSLSDAIGVTRVALLALTGPIGRRAAWLPLRQELITSHPALTARSLTKEPHYARTSVELLVKHGATVETAILAVGVAAACHRTAEATTTGTPDQLAAALDAAFRRLATLDRTILRARLAQVSSR